MSRWSYIIARLVILSLIALGLWFGADPLTRWVVSNSLQNATGAKVEIGLVRTSIKDNKLYLKDLTIADPSEPMSNLAQVDMVQLDFNRAELAQRRIVIPNAKLFRLMFFTPRTYSGALPDVPQKSQVPFIPLSNSELVGEKIAQTWVDSLELTPVQDKLDNQNLFESANELNQRWRKPLNQLEQRVSSLALETNAVGAEVDKFDGNLLRWDPNNVNRLSKIDSETASIREQLLKYQTSLAKEIQKLNLATKIDANQIKSSTQSTNFNADAMSQLLLASTHSEYVDQAVNLFRWFQHLRPELSTDFKNKSLRGRNIDLGATARPLFVIEQADLSGEGKFFDQHFNFAGEAFNFSTDPNTLDSPTRFEIRAQGHQHFYISCELDRRNERMIDKLTISCPEIILEERLLGVPGRLEVMMSQGAKLQANVELSCDRDQLSGTINLNFSNVSLHVENIDKLAGGTSVALQMNEGKLGLINDFSSTISLSGLLEQRKISSSSELGKKFSNAVNETIASKRSNTVKERLKQLETTRQLQITSIKQAIAERLANMLNSIDKNKSHVAELQAAIPNVNLPTTRWR